MVTGPSKPLDHNEPFEFESDNKTAEVEIDLEPRVGQRFDISPTSQFKIIEFYT
jgi:hypothetical protein